MGNLLKIPHSELSATLEIWERLGVEARHFEASRKDPARASAAAQAIIAGYILVDPMKADTTLSRDMRKEGWTLTEKVSRKIASITDLKLVPILKKGETSINGEEMVRRARKELNANLGQEDAEWLLEHQSEIPKEWRSYYLTFPGTVWRDSFGRRRVTFLHWRGQRWYLDFRWLGHGWCSDDRLLPVGKF